MSILVKEPSAIFLHIPKTAGRSTRSWLQTNCKGFEPKHKVMHMDYAWNKKYIQKAYGIDISTIFSFTIVRNPWDRIVSAYYDYLSKNAHCSFEDFIKEKLITTTFKKQMYHYVGENTYVMRFENLQNDFKRIQDYFSIEHKLDHVGKTNHTHYSEYYNNELINIIREKYSTDIERFDYEFQKI